MDNVSISYICRNAITISYLFQSIGKKYYVEKSEMMRDKSQSKWNKTLVIRGYYMETIGNITNETIKNI